MMSNEAKELEGQLIDPNTGEVVDIMEYEPQDANLLKLPQIVRGLRAITRRIDTIREYQKAEVERINAICEDKAEKLQNRYDYLMGISGSMMEELGEKKMDYAGLGTLSIRKGREYVDDSGYSLSSDEQKRELYQKIDDDRIFKLKTTVSPDKKKIRRVLEGNMPDRQGFWKIEPEAREALRRYFSIQKKEDELVFKPE